MTREDFSDNTLRVVQGAKLFVVGGVLDDMRFLRGVNGRVLTCGCLLGVYETYDGRIITTIDARGPACDQPSHRLHEAVSDPASGRTDASPAPPNGRVGSRS